MTTAPRPHCNAFTVIELLWIVAICAILAVLLMSGLGHVREVVARTACQQTQRSLHVYFMAYAQDHQGCLPAGYDSGKQPWVERIKVYFSGPVDKKVGDAYCPSTRTSHSDILFQRDRATWRTDYNVNSNVLTPVEEDNRVSQISPRLVLLYDGGGGARVSGSDAKATARHGGAFNILFVDGHVEVAKAFDANYHRWKR